MFRLITRFVGYWLIAGGLVLAVVDGTRSLAASSLVLTPLGQSWYDLSPSTLNAAQAGIQRHVAPWLWDPVAQTALLAPTALVLFGVGALLVFAGTRRPRPFEAVA